MAVMIFAGQMVFSQSVVQKTDTLQVKQNKEQTDGQTVRQNNGGNGQAGNNAAYQGVKRVRAGRPDMTRARGARPPMIVRPSGSGVPKGIGKPGGAGRGGGR